MGAGQKITEASPNEQAGIGLDEEERWRYSRQIMLPEIGLAGQGRLKAARVLCLGAGGLGSPAALYLAAAGVGTIGLVDNDRVALSNLHRQLLHGTGDVGRAKTESARERLREVNPQIEVRLHPCRFESGNAEEILRDYDLIVDGTDNFATRYLSNDVAVFAGKPNVYGSIFRFDGQTTVFAPHLGGPCYRCLFPEPPPPGAVPSCAEAGVLGVLPGIVGTMQATEALKLILGLGEPLIGWSIRKITPRRDANASRASAESAVTQRHWHVVRTALPVKYVLKNSRWLMPSRFWSRSVTPVSELAIGSGEPSRYSSALVSPRTTR